MPVRPLDDDLPPQAAESPAEQAARDSWLDAEGRHQLALAHDSIAKLDALLSVTVPGQFRNVLLEERASWLSFADAQQQRPYRLLRTHYKVRPGQPDVATLLRMRPDGRYEIAVRTRGITTPEHSYGDRASAEFRFEQMT